MGRSASGHSFLGGKRIWLIIAIVVILVVLGLIFFGVFNSGGGGGGNNNHSTFDNSDSPVPPSTLQLNNTYQPPKRNCNITHGGSAESFGSGLKEDRLNGKYYEVHDDSSYKL